MNHGTRKAENWTQILGGLTILLVIPVITVLCLSPDFHEWVRTTIGALLRSEDTALETKRANAAERIKQYRLPDSISKIAKISEEEPDLSKTAPPQSSDLSHAVLRLQRALEAYPDPKTRNVFHIVNTEDFTAKTAPCPFVSISGEQSVLLRQNKHLASLAETLNRCAEAVEQAGKSNKPSTPNAKVPY